MTKLIGPGAATTLTELWLTEFRMYGMYPGIGELQLAIGQRVCISQARRPGDFFPAFRSRLLDRFQARYVCFRGLPGPLLVGVEST